MKPQAILSRVTRRGSIGALVLLVLVSGCTDDTPAAPQTAAERGMALVAANGCTACHALDGRRGIGPGWGGLYGATRKLKDGRSVVADDSYLRRAMLEPAADVVEGFDNVMIPAAVSNAQITDIIALIRELKGTTTP